jgi:class 3 adenylate cyclase
VLSGAVRSAVLDELAEGVALRELGAWRFRGLPEPVTIYQVEAEGLLGEFPPLRSAVPIPR